MAELKGAKEAAQGPSATAVPQSTKRKAPDSESQDATKSEAPLVPQVQPSTSALPTNFDKSRKESTRATVGKASGLGFLSLDCDDEEDEEEEEGGGRGEGRRGMPVSSRPPHRARNTHFFSREATGSRLPSNFSDTTLPRPL